MGTIYRLPLKQSIGVAATPVVAAGQRVARGTLVASPEGLGVPLHAGVSGVVHAVTDTAIDIDADAVQEPGFVPLPEQGGIVEMVKAAGICGMGGAGFPTHVKLGTKFDGGACIVNAVECEPVLHHNITPDRAGSGQGILRVAARHAGDRHRAGHHCHQGQERGCGGGSEGCRQKWGQRTCPRIAGPLSHG